MYAYNTQTNTDRKSTCNKSARPMCGTVHKHKCTWPILYWLTQLRQDGVKDNRLKSAQCICPV